MNMTTETHSTDEDANWSWRRSALFVLLLSIPLFLIALGHYDLDSKAEPREGLTAWEMIHSGDWMLPVLNGEQLPEKPLMFPWLVALATLVLGEGGEWAARLPAALSAVGAVLVVLALGRRLLGPRGGFLAACVFASTFLVVSLARRARVDMTLTLFVTLAIWLFVEELTAATERPQEPARKGRLALFWLALALGTLTKGPLGAILPGLAIGSLLVARRQLGYLKRLFPWWGVALYVVVAGSWYAYGLARDGDGFAYRSFFMENFMMFFGEARGGGHRHEATYFVARYFLFGLPWSFLLPAAIAWMFRRGGGSWTRGPLALPLLSFGSMFVFFSIAAGKRADYLLPLLPAASILVAAMWDEAPRAFADRVVRPMMIVSAGLLALSGIAAAGVGAAALILPAEIWGPRFAAELTSERTRDFIGRITSNEFALGAGAVGLLAVFVAPLAGVFGTRPRRAVIVAVIGAAVASTAAAFTVMAAVAAQASLKPFAMEVERVAGPNADIRNFADFQPAVMYYLRRRLPVIVNTPGAGNPEMDAFLAEPGEAFILTDETSWNALRVRRGARLEVAVPTTRLDSEPGDTPILIRRR